MRNLDPEFRKFLDSGGDIKEVLQDVIDHLHYTPGFWSELRINLMNRRWDAPFEVVTKDGQTTRVLKQPKLTSNAA